MFVHCGLDAEIQDVNRVITLPCSPPQVSHVLSAREQREGVPGHEARVVECAAAGCRFATALLDRRLSLVSGGRKTERAVRASHGVLPWTCALRCLYAVFGPAGSASRPSHPSGKNWRVCIGAAAQRIVYASVESWDKCRGVVLWGSAE